MLGWTFCKNVRTVDSYLLFCMYAMHVSFVEYFSENIQRYELSKTLSKIGCYCPLRPFCFFLACSRYNAPCQPSDHSTFFFKCSQRNVEKVKPLPLSSLCCSFLCFSYLSPLYLSCKCLILTVIQVVTQVWIFNMYFPWNTHRWKFYLFFRYASHANQGFSGEPCGVVFSNFGYCKREHTQEEKWKEKRRQRTQNGFQEYVIIRS